MRDPGELLQTVFDLVVARLQEFGIELPERQYISAGNAVAYDTEQLTVNLNRVAGGRPGGEDSVQFAVFRVYLAEIQITLLRKGPMIGARGALPDVGTESSIAATWAQDMMGLTQVLGDIAADGSLFPAGMLNIPVSVGPTLPYGPSGGIVGSVAVLSVQLV